MKMVSLKGSLDSQGFLAFNKQRFYMENSLLYIYYFKVSPRGTTKEQIRGLNFWDTLIKRRSLESGGSEGFFS